MSRYNNTAQLDYLGKKLLNCNHAIFKLLTGVIPEKKSVIKRYLQQFNFFVIPDKKGVNLYTKDNKVCFDAKTLHTVWLTSFVYCESLFNEQMNPFFLKLTNSLIDVKTGDKLIELSKDTNNEYAIQNILRNCKFESETLQNTVDLIDEKNKEDLFFKINNKVDELLKKSNLNEFMWPESLIKPEEPYCNLTMKNLAARELALIALAYVVLHEINHCIQKHTCVGVADLLRQEELDCDQFALDFITNDINVYVKSSHEDTNLVKQKRLLGVLVGFLFIAESTGPKESEFYPDLRYRLNIIIEKADKILHNNNSYFWLVTATLLFMKLSVQSTYLDIQYNKARDIVDTILLNFKIK